MKPCVQSPALHKQGIVLFAYNPSTQEAKQGEQKFKVIHSYFVSLITLGYMRAYHMKEKIKEFFHRLEQSTYFLLPTLLLSYLIDLVFNSYELVYKIIPQVNFLWRIIY